MLVLVFWVALVFGVLPDGYFGFGAWKQYAEDKHSRGMPVYFGDWFANYNIHPIRKGMFTLALTYCFVFLVWLFIA